MHLKKSFQDLKKGRKREKKDIQRAKRDRHRNIETERLRRKRDKESVIGAHAEDGVISTWLLMTLENES